MNNRTNIHTLAALCLLAVTTGASTHATGEGWSVVPFIGLSDMSDQYPVVSGADAISNGTLDVALDTGFTAGLGLRYDYTNSRWTSVLGWEYRTNNSETTAFNGIELPGGNYASNIFFLNARYALNEGRKLTPWVGGGLTWVQEIDLDIENTDGERSFADSGAFGFQIMAGADYDLTKRVYFTSELRYSSLTGLELSEEIGGGLITDIDYQSVTFGVGLGFRF